MLEVKWEKCPAKCLQETFISVENEWKQLENIRSLWNPSEDIDLLMKSTDCIILEVIINKEILKCHAEIATWPQGIIQAD